MKKVVVGVLFALSLAGCAAKSARIAANCPLAGTAACPLTSCPLAGTPECPLKKASCCAAGGAVAEAR